MPQISRYSDEHVEQLLSELANVLEKHKAPADLSLMVLGNMVTNPSLAPNEFTFTPPADADVVHMQGQ